MNLKMRMYYLLINRVPGIRTKYNNYRKHNQGIKRVKAWCYLGILNFRYYILRQYNIGEEVLYPDKNKKIINGSESRAFSRPTPEEMFRKLEKYDVVSFDVFDTLILRKLRLPEDVFFLMQKELHYMDFKRLRTNAEWKARQKRFKDHGDYEVTLKEIWDELHEMTTIHSEEGMRKEFDCEKSVCYANPYFMEIIKLLKRAGKKIIVCSDMYLNAEHIQSLLKNAGYPEFDRYFVSCEYRKSKATGALFDIVKKELGTNVRYVHIGDNEHSDIQCAQKKGFDTIYYKSVQDVGGNRRAMDMSGITSSIYSGIVNGYLHNGIEKKNPLYEFGYIYGGLFAVGYCQFIHDYAKNNDIDKVIFLARDGDVLEKVYEKMFPEEKQTIAYALWSRLAATKLCAHRFKEFYFERMIYHKVNQGYTLKSVFATMEAYSLIKEFIESYPGNISEDSLLDDTLMNALVDFINTNWERITNLYKDQLEEGKRYYSKLIQGANRVAVVDVGWVGSGAISLKHLIEYEWKLNCKVFGLVAGSCSGTGIDCDATAIEYADGDISSFFFSASNNRDIWKIHDAAKGHNMIVELLLSSNKKSFRGFQKDEEGNYQFSSKREMIDADSIQNGILDFVDHYKAHPLSDIKISGRDAMAPILLLYQNEEYMDSILHSSGINPNVV